MNRLEEKLKKALQRVDPPQGFAEHVLARAAKHAQARRLPSWLTWFRANNLRWATVCALCIVLAASGIVYRRQEHKRGEQAKEQLMLALRITSSKLQVVTHNVRDLNYAEPQP